SDTRALPSFPARRSSDLNSHQDGGGAGGNRHALGGANQLAVELGDDQADGLGSAGAVGNNVHSGSASAAQVALAMGAVQNHLVRSEEHTSELQSRFDLVC